MHGLKSRDKIEFSCILHFKVMPSRLDAVIGLVSGTIVFHGNSTRDEVAMFRQRLRVHRVHVASTETIELAGCQQANRPRNIFEVYRRCRRNAVSGAATKACHTFVTVQWSSSYQILNLPLSFCFAVSFFSKFYIDHFRTLDCDT